jgi:ubiquinone/menaquinone biosynthesis C-methylase UbiE
MSTTQTVPVNHWPQNKCAKAFWGQRELPSYKRLLQDTVAWLDPQPGESWIDLGCGGGQLSKALWEKSEGTLEEVVALDCAAANEKALRKLRPEMDPPAPERRVRFLHADFSRGLASCEDNSFDGAVSGLAIQYAESFCTETGKWTSGAYDALLREVWRVLRPGGVFVFSVNRPEPSWFRVAFSGVWGFFLSSNPFRFLKNSARMWRYGGWLKKQARAGRFHYLPSDLVRRKLEQAGLAEVEVQLSFAGQAYVVRCRKPAA